MKRVLFAALLCFGGLTAAHAACPDPMSVLGEVFPKQAQKYEMLEQRRLSPGLCAAFVREKGRIKVRVFTYSEDGKYVVFGNVFDVKQRRPWGTDVIAKYERVEDSILKALDGAAVRVGKSKNTVFLAADPLCPYCKKAVKDLKPLVDKGEISVKMLFLPVHGEKSRKLIEHVLCSSSSDNLLDVYLSSGKDVGDPRSCESGRKRTARMEKILRDAGISATPTFIFEDGGVASGYAPGPAVAMRASMSGIMREASQSPQTGADSSKSR